MDNDATKSAKAKPTAKVPTPAPVPTVTPPTDPIKKDYASFQSLIETSPNFQFTKEELVITTKQSLTGITNLVVNHEDQTLVDSFLNSCFKKQELYNNTIDIDAVELQGGAPGKGAALRFLDELIYGTFETKKDPNTDMVEIVVDPRTGKRMRRPDGFVNRKEIVVNPKDTKDKLLIIKNIDYCLDFCKSDTPGEVDPRALALFDNFRNPTVKKGCRILIISNKQIKFPFKIRTVELPKVNETEAMHIISGFTGIYTKNNYTVNFTENQKSQIIRKLSGLTYTEAGDALAFSLSRAETMKGSKIIDTSKALKVLRQKINATFMEDGHGLTHLSPRPWEDYICPESSNFTYDVMKLLKDFKEIEALKKQQESLVKAGQDDASIQKIIDAIQIRIPHVIVLFGKGGVGKSAFPVHLAGLLEFDVWDFNINATHSKWIGEGSKQMRESLKKITDASHVIIRIDEYDRAIGASGEAGQGMHEAHKQVESEFMNWLQNSQEESLFMKKNIILVLTTNHKDNITGPLLRSGRSDLVIDIDHFDSKSMKTTFKTAARRMKNRGIQAIGFDTPEALQAEVDKLDLDQLAELATLKGFTVRDVEMLLIEMAAHRYYNAKYHDSLDWNNETFVKVMELSQGSTRDSGTGELVLGDRQLLMEKTKKPSEEKPDDQQLNFPFYKDNLYDEAKFKDVNFFR